MKKNIVKAAFIMCIVGIFGFGYTVLATAMDTDDNSGLQDVINEDMSDGDIQLGDSDNSNNINYITENSGIIYYLNMKRYEMLSDYYKKMSDLLLRKVELYKLLKDSGEITDLTVRQIETQEQQMAGQKSICDNEAEYNRFIISRLGLSFDDVDTASIKSVRDIESYCSEKTMYEIVNTARYVTDCKNAIENIKAKERELETFSAVCNQMKLLKDAGEVSELEIIDSELEVLKAEMELEEYYYDMNVAYYEMIN